MSDKSNKEITKAKGKTAIGLQGSSISSESPLNGDSQNPVFELPKNNNARYYEDDLFYCFYKINDKED